MSRQEEKPKTRGFQGRGIESMSWKRAHTSDAPFVVYSPPSASTLRAVSNLVDNPQRLEPQTQEARRGVSGETSLAIYTHKARPFMKQVQQAVDRRAK
ncbi:hypothetical protein VCV18_009395 [Metarhizium anisopliae]